MKERPLAERFTKFVGPPPMQYLAKDRPAAWL